ncbi:MAG: MchE protein [Planctomycetia bacterium]|nr:MchE protein [Planctomycetia bacterium]
MVFMVKKLVGFVRNLLLLGVVIGLAVAGYLTRDRWLPLLAAPAPTAADHEPHDDEPHHDEPTAAAADTLELSSRARKNLGVVSRPARLATFRRTIDLPGRVVDRPGRSDRGITSPAVGIVTVIHAFPGDTVQPGDRLFTLRLLSEYVQNTQSELFKVTREIELETEKQNRLKQIGEGAIAPVRLIEVDQQLRRLAAASQSHRQELLTRGLSPAEIDQIASGTFVTTIEVRAPQPDSLPQQSATSPTARPGDDGPITYEVQELRVELGSQVQAGQLLAMLADHRQLFIAGHAFKRETPLLERATRAGWPIEVEFAEDDPTAWPPLTQPFEIHHFSNTVDPETRTLDFFIPLINQASRYTKGDKNFVVWRFRPGQRVRLHVPVEELEGVIVLPAGAVVREGPEAYVFRQNGDLFKRLPVHLLHADRRQAVLANDGSVAPGWYLAQSSAATLNRVLKDQTASGAPVGVHVHADGTVHAAH